MSEFAERLAPRPTSYTTSVVSETALPEGREEVLSKKLLKRNERIIKRRMRLPIKLAAAALTLQSLWAGYNIDTHINRLEAAESEPDIKVLSQEYVNPAEPSTTFYLAGFDTRNGDTFGEQVGVAIHQILPGVDASIDYGNAPLDAEEIAKRIISYAEEAGLSNISIAGNSLGGKVAAKVVEYIVLNSYLEVAAVITNATPADSDDLRPKTQNDLATMMGVFENLKGVDAKHSTFARYALTLAQEHENFVNTNSGIFDPGAFWEVSGKTWERINENRVPGMWLTIDQALAITDIDLEEIMMNIGKQRGEKRMPVFVVMRTANPDDDTVVLVEQASKKICDSAAKAGIVCTIVQVQDAIHTSYRFNTQIFTDALAPVAEPIRSDMDQEALEFALSRLDTWAESNLHPQR